MSKQRPSTIVKRRPAPASKTSPAGFQAAYWRRRLFKNSYTRDGQRLALKGWSVKIQHQGRRQTFSLTATSREKAAREAWRIYRTIVSPARETLARHRIGPYSGGTSVSPKPSLDPLVTRDAGYWKPRLLNRKPFEFLHPRVPKEFSVRIEHAGTSHYFLLGTNDEAEAADKAAKIHQTVTSEGWEVANERFDRELTLAFHWSSNPVAWTYATLHTQHRRGPSLPAISPPSQMPSLGVAIIEPEDGIRLALAARVNCQSGFCCEATFSNATEALQRNPRQQLDLVLVNQVLPDRPGTACLEEMQRTTPRLAGLQYAVYEDSDELFRAAPGGAVGYLLKRTSPLRIFEPLADATGPLTREYIAARIREYFQNLLTAMPVGLSSPELSKLTAREHEILTLLSKGGVAKDIANTLGISLWTVHGHVKRIFEKLNVHTRTEAVVKFLQK